MDNKYEKIAKCISNAMKCLLCGDENGANNQATLCRELLAHIPNDQFYTKIHMSKVFSDFFNIMSMSPQTHFHYQTQGLSLIRDLYGEDHPVLSDIYSTLSEMAMREKNFNQAIEFAGRCHLIRVCRLGKGHTRTADSHLVLGNLYAAMKDSEKALRELRMCRAVRVSLSSEISVEVAEVDLFIGSVLLESNPKLAYISFYKSYRTRYVLLGAGHKQTRYAKQLLYNNRSIDGERLLCGIELKERTMELKWNDEKPQSLQYSVSLFVHRLNAEDVLSVSQVRSMVAAAVQFAHSRMCAEPAEYAGEFDLSSDEGKETLNAISMLLMMEPIPSATQYKSQSLVNGEKRSPKRSAMEANTSSPVPTITGLSATTTPSVVSSGMTPTTQPICTTSTGTASSKSPKPRPGMLSKERQLKGQLTTEKLEFTTEEDRQLAESLSRLVGNNELENNSSGDEGDDEGNRDQIDDLLGNSPTKSMRIISSYSSIPAARVLNVVSTISQPEQSSSSVQESKASGTGHKGNKDGNDELASEWEEADPTLPGNASKGNARADPFAVYRDLNANQNVATVSAKTGSPLKASIGGRRNSPGGGVLVQSPGSPPSPSKFASRSRVLSVVRSHYDTMDNSQLDPTQLPAAKHYTPMPSPHWSTQASSASSAALKNGSSNNRTNPFAGSLVGINDHRLAWNIGKATQCFTRDSADNLLIMKKATARELVQTLQVKLLAFGLFPWLVNNKNNLKIVGARRSSIQMAAAKLDEAKKSSVLSFFNHSQLQIGGGGGLAGSGGSGRRGSMAFTQSMGDTGAAAAAGRTDDSLVCPRREKHPPEPPPVPPSEIWPPQPFHPEPAGAGGGDKGSSATAEGESPSDEPLDEAAADALAADRKKPKLKQMYLTGLVSIENTFWGEPSEVDLPADLLFDDIEEEFALGLAKPKKINQNAAMKGPPGNALGGLAAAALARKGRVGEATSQQLESVLDPTRAQNMNIMLAQFGKRHFFDLAEAIRLFDYSVLSIAVIQSLLQFIPSSDEFKTVRAFVQKLAAGAGAASVESAMETTTTTTATVDTAANAAIPEGDPEAASIQKDRQALSKTKVGRAEQFIFAMSTVPKLEKRLTAMASVLVAQETFQIITTSAESILVAVNQVRGSSKLKFLMKCFLDLANALCKKSKSPNTLPITGFTLSSLSKLSQTKTNSGEPAEQYVVGKLLVHCPEVLDVADDMPGVEAARAVMFARLNSDLRKLEEGNEVMRSILKSKPEENVASSTNISNALETSEKLYSRALKVLKEAQNDYKELCEYFGEQELATMDPEALFGQVMLFVRAVQAAAKFATAKMKRKQRKIEHH